MMEEGASGGNPEKPAAADGGSGSVGAGAAAAADPKAALTEDVNGSGAELWKEDSSRMDKSSLGLGVARFTNVEDWKCHCSSCCHVSED